MLPYVRNASSMLEMLVKRSGKWSCERLFDSWMQMGERLGKRNVKLG